MVGVELCLIERMDVADGCHKHVLDTTFLNMFGGIAEGVRQYSDLKDVVSEPYV